MPRTRSGGAGSERSHGGGGRGGIRTRGGGASSRSGSRASRGRDRTGRYAAMPDIPEWYYLGNVSDLPVGVPLTKRRRRLRPSLPAHELNQEDPAPSTNAGVSGTPQPGEFELVQEDPAPSTSAGVSGTPQPGQFELMQEDPAPSTSAGVCGTPRPRVLMVVPEIERLLGSSSSSVPSPDAFLETASSLPATPRPRRFVVNLGSEDEDDNDDEHVAMVPRDVRMYFEKDETELPDTQADFTWPPTASHLSTSPQPPASPQPLASPSLGAFGPSNLFQFVWKPLPSPPINPEIRREKFQEEVGPTVAVADPYEAFMAIWGSIVDHIVVQTNKYAREMLAARQAVNTLKGQSRITAWLPIDDNELLVYFAIVMAMSIVQKNVLVDYWNVEQNIFYTPKFSASMSRNRFQLISRCLHFNDNSLFNQTVHTSAAEAKLYKLEPITSYLNVKFSQLYRLHQNISLDESLTQWKGWLSIKQCIPNKAASSGVKTCEICESRTGYLYRFEVHAKYEPVQPVVDSPISGFVPSLVLRLLQGLDNRGHCVWMDNFYNSPALARVLKSKGFDCVGTLRTNRSHVPRELNLLKTGKIPMPKGHLVGCTSSDIDLFVWHDSTRVAFISTYHGMGVHHCPVENKVKPILVRDYNVSMGALDKKDQILYAYPIERKKQMVWYKKFFFRLLNISILNASIIYNSQPPPHTTMSQRQFRQTLILQLLQRHQNLVVPTSSHITTGATGILTNDIVAHFTIPYDIVPGMRERTRRSCVFCHQRTRSHCPACKVPLCFTPCAQLYHTRRA